jgi:hypothetical protein
MGKALGTWILLSLFGFVGWNYAAPQFLQFAGRHPLHVMTCFGIAAVCMIGLILSGKNK